MANINLYSAYEQKRRKFGVNDSARFRASFVDAVNMVYGELNDQVFRAETLEQIGSHDDIIDERLMGFTSITFDATAGGAVDAMEDREFWAAEWELEVLSATNGMTDTIDTGTDVVITIADGVFTVTQTGVVVASATLPTFDTGTVRFESTSAGNALLVAGTAVTLTYTTGDDETSLPITTITSRVINGFSGLTLNRTRFLSASTVIFDFLINEGTGVTLTDEVGELTAAILPNPANWVTVYIEPSASLDKRFYSPFMQGLDYFLQLGGEWSMEDDQDNERRWYSRSIPQARNINQQQTTYGTPTGI